jgi:DNA-binding NtrC family response regulator
MHAPGTKPGNQSDPSPGTPTLLIVDDEAGMRRSLRRALDDEPYTIIEAESADAALALLRTRTIHVVLSDHNMPGMTGLDFLRTVRLRHSSVVRMICTASDEFDVAVRAINLGEVSRFIRKPWDDDELRCAVRQAFEHAALEREVRRLRLQGRRQHAALLELETRYPGIAAIRRDTTGAIVLDELPEDNEARLHCEALWRDDS